MTSYVTVAEFRIWFEQIPTSATMDAKIQAALNDATAIVDDALGFSFGGYGVAAAARRFSSNGGRLLHLPYHEAGSLVAASIKPVYEDLTTGSAILYWEVDAVDHTYVWRADGWPRGRYEATAKWGYGLAPTDVKRVCFEKASNLYIGAQGGQFSDIVGVDGAGAVGYNRAWTNSQRDILDQVRLRYGDVGFS